MLKLRFVPFFCLYSLVYPGMLLLEAMYLLLCSWGMGGAASHSSQSSHGTSWTVRGNGETGAGLGGARWDRAVLLAQTPTIVPEMPV